MRRIRRKRLKQKLEKVESIGFYLFFKKEKNLERLKHYPELRADRKLYFWLHKNDSNGFDHLACLMKGTYKACYSFSVIAKERLLLTMRFLVRGEVNDLIHLLHIVRVEILFLVGLFPKLAVQYMIHCRNTLHALNLLSE